MASSLLLITSNLVTRCVIRRSVIQFRPTAVSDSRFLSIITGHRSYTSMQIDDFYKDWVRNRSPTVSSMSFSMTMSTEEASLLLYLPNEGSVKMNIPRLEKDNTLLFKGKTRIELPYNTSNNIIEDGMLKETLPDGDESKTNIMVDIMANIVTSFRDIPAKRTWPYYDMFFDRSILGEGFCPLLPMLSPINSFSIFKEETDENLWIRIKIPGLQKVKLTTQGLQVCLDMPKDEEFQVIGMEREDIKTYFDYNTLFIEGKSKNYHTIAGIHLPEGIKHSMIKRKMKKGLFYAFLPFVKK